MSEKILSIIVPSYNMEKYLPKCLGSLVVAPELMERLEVLVVNDGSKDRTSVIAHEFAAKYPQVFKVIDKANGHYGSCINRGLAEATGVWIKVLDADDWFDTENFARYLLFLMQEEGKGADAADLIVNDFEFVSEHGRIRKSYDFIQDGAVSVGDFDFCDGRDLWMHAVAYKTDKLRGIGYEQLTGITHTDIQWLHLPMSTVSVVARFPEVLYEYLYLREGNTSTPDEFYKTYWVQVNILRRMFEEYEKAKDCIGVDQALYLLNHLRYRSTRAYQVHLLVRSPLLKCGTLEAFDAYLKEASPVIYGEMDHVTYSKAIPYRYVKAWRVRRRLTFGLRVRLTLCRYANGTIRRLRRFL